MFTGIIETLGTISNVSRDGGDLRLVIAAPAFKDKHIALGDSIAISGVCLTVIEHKGDEFSFDVSVESLDHSLIGNWQAGHKVNMELAMLPTTRFGGHLVSGHVDGLAELVEMKSDARSWRMVFAVPQSIQKYIAKKGSITIDGISLTVNDVNNNMFSINVIPHTFQVTTLSGVQVGEYVHIEVDLIARYLERLLTADKPADSTISQSFLAEHGFT
ncbi:MAG: riboflavin synthase [Arenicella sp.]|nr:riboflavin synthase [Arenicella sp.]